MTDSDPIANPFQYAYCPKCGASLEIAIVEHFPRLRCVRCSFIFYQNPVPAVGAVLIVDDQILLVKRKYEPRAGFWSLPAGFIEYSETVIQALVREVKEETNLDIKIGDLINVYSAVNDPSYHVILVVYRVELLGGELAAGDDAVAARFFPLSGPLPELAFSSHLHAIQEASAVNPSSTGRTA